MPSARVVNPVIIIKFERLLIIITKFLSIVSF